MPIKVKYESKITITMPSGVEETITEEEVVSLLEQLKHRLEPKVTIPEYPQKVWPEPTTIRELYTILSLKSAGLEEIFYGIHNYHKIMMIDENDLEYAEDACHEILKAIAEYRTIVQETRKGHANGVVEDME